MSLFLVTIAHNLLKDVILDSSSFEIKNHRIHNDGHLMILDFTSNTNVKELDDKLCQSIMATSNDTIIVRNSKESSYRLEFDISIRVNHLNKEMIVEIDRTDDKHYISIANSIKKYFGLSTIEVSSGLLGISITSSLHIDYNDAIELYKSKLNKSFGTNTNYIAFTTKHPESCNMRCNVPFGGLTMNMTSNGHISIYMAL